MAHDQNQFASDVRVGIIAFVGVLFLILGIAFAGGDKGLLLRKTSTVKARLSDVGGLKKGGSVTMGGMVVGKVTDITFVNDTQATAEEKNQIEVTMEVRSDMRHRIFSNSVPAVRTQGMLGDRYVDIPPGSKDSPVLKEGQILTGAKTTDFDKTLGQAIAVLSETEKLLSAVNQQRGTVGQLLYDEKFYNHLLDITAELNDLIKDFKKNPRRYIKFSVF